MNLTFSKIALITLLMISGFCCFSQSSSSEDKREYYFGAKIGLNNGWMYMTDQYSEGYSEGNPAFMLGIYGVIPFSKRISFSPELIYSVDGGRYKERYGSDVKVFFYRVSMPLLLRVQVTKFMEFHAGAQIGYLFAHLSETETSTSNRPELYDDITYDAVLGVEAHVKRYSLGLRYNFGLQNIYNEDLPEFKFESYLERRLRTLQCYVGIRIN